jgi:hypothetical protein
MDVRNRFPKFFGFVVQSTPFPLFGASIQTGAQFFFCKTVNDSKCVRFEILTAAKMTMLVFWVVTPCGLLVDTNVSEEHTAPTFRADIYLQVYMAL